VSQVARDSVAMTRRIMAAAALKPYAPVEIIPGEAAGGSNAQKLLDKAIADVGTTIFHPVGTCR
jgi:choline dehydrogenase